MTDHPSRKELLAVVRGDITPERTEAILLHLYKGCKKCLAAAPSALRFGFGLEGKITAKEESALDAAIQRAFKTAARHDRHLREQEVEAKEGEKILAAGGVGAPTKFPRRMGTLAKYKALLARSWSLRHENTGEMVYFARLAVQCAELLNPKRYGVERVFDFQCRAQAELGNALRVSDQFEHAATAFGRAWRLFELGTQSEVLEIKLLDLEASFDADCRRLQMACIKLKKVLRWCRKNGDEQHAGKILLQLGRFAGYAGDPEEALKFLGESLALIDEREEPALAWAARLNQVDFLLACGQFRDAEKRLFQLRGLQYEAGSINKLQLRWVEGRLEGRFNRLDRAERAFREVQTGFLEVNRAYDSALVSLDLSAVLLAQGKADDAKDVVEAAYKIFTALKIQREALMAVLALKTACQMRLATRAMAEEIARYVRRLEHDPGAKLEGKAWGGEDS